MTIIVIHCIHLGVNKVYFEENIAYIRDLKKYCVYNPASAKVDYRLLTQTNKESEQKND